MNPVSPVIPGVSESYEILLGANQPQYIPVPVVLAEGDEKRMYSRWEFTEEERAIIADGGSLLYAQLTFGHPFQPVCFEIVRKKKPSPVQIMDNMIDGCLCNGVGCVRCCGPS